MVSLISNSVARTSKSVKTVEAKKLSQACTASMKARFINIEASGIFSISAYLDPRFKKKAFSNPDSIKVCRDRIIRQMAVISTDKEDETTETVNVAGTSSGQKNVVSKSSLLWDTFDKSVKDLTSNSTENSTAIVELRSYTDEKMIDRHEDPLEFWQKREPSYPKLAKLAKKFLMIPATSVPCERVFSKAGELITDRRNRLSAKHVDQLLFLNANCDL